MTLRDLLDWMQYGEGRYIVRRLMEVAKAQEERSQDPSSGTSSNGQAADGRPAIKPPPNVPGQPAWQGGETEPIGLFEDDLAAMEQALREAG